LLWMTLATLGGAAAGYFIGKRVDEGKA